MNLEEARGRLEKYIQKVFETNLSESAIDEVVGECLTLIIQDTIKKVTGFEYNNWSRM